MLPIDLIYGTGPRLVENQSVGEYATSLKNRISAAFDLVRTKMYHNTMCTKRKFMIRRCMGNHLIQEIGCGCIHLWLAEVVAVNLIAHERNVMKNICDATYRVKYLQRQKDRQIVHFKRLKPCPKNICLE